MLSYLGEAASSSKHMYVEPYCHIITSASDFIRLAHKTGNSQASHKLENLTCFIVFRFPVILGSRNNLDTVDTNGIGA